VGGSALDAGVKAAPRLRLEPAPSHIGHALIATACALVALLTAAIPLPPADRLAIWATTVFAWRSGRARCVGGEVPVCMLVGTDRRVTVTTRDGRTTDGAILDATYVGAFWTGMVWRPDGAPWWRPARAFLLLPDSLSADDLRQLRIRLRYGRPQPPSSSGRVAS
jgi:hypothetical protein